MNLFETNIHRQLSEVNFIKVQKVKIGIAGLGGLGSNCAMNLVRSGFKKFKLIDFDKVEQTNLNRQFYFQDQIGMLKTDALAANLKRINPDLQLETYSLKIDRSNITELFSDCDVVVECFDQAEDKSMLVEKIMPLGKLVVSASGLAGIGNSDLIKVQKIKENLIIIGDLVSDVKDSFPISPRVNITAAKQADVILDFTLNNKG